LIDHDADGIAARGHIFVCIGLDLFLPAAHFIPTHIGMILHSKPKNFLASNRVFRFIPNMAVTNIGDSKLCADKPRHARAHGVPPRAFAQLGKGRAFGPPRCIPSLAPRGAAETVPVSAPFGFTRVVAFRSWEARP